MGTNSWMWLNNEEVILRREAWFQELERVFENKTPVHSPFYLKGYEAIGRSNPYEEPEKWVGEVLANIENNGHLAMDDQHFRPLVLECGLYGVHFIDRILGAEVFFKDEQWYSHYLANSPGTLQKPDLDSNETWLLAKRIAKAFCDFRVKLPLFGMPTISSALNVALNLYGGELLADLCEDPEEVEKDLKTINGVLCDIHRWYIKNIPIEQLQPVISWERTQPHGSGQICGCSTQLISASMYKEFFSILDEEILSLYPNGGMIHLCGNHIQHIPVWRKMKSLHAVQLNDRATWDLERYFNELREDQVIYIIPSKEMSVEKALQITGGKRLIIQR